MLHLINLERRKIKLWRYVSIASTLVMALFAMMVVIMTYEDPQALSIVEMNSVQTSFITCVTIITAAFLFTELIIDEYEKNRINEMFTYPISRKKIITAKLMMVIGFPIVLNVLLAYILAVLTYSVHLTIPLFSEQQSLSYFLKMIKDTLPIYVISPFFLIIPSFIGFIKRSRGWAIGLSMLFAGIMTSNNGGFSLQNSQIITMIIAVAAICICYFGLISKVEREDIE